MTEKQKMLAGELYRPTDEELTKERLAAKKLSTSINTMHESEKSSRDQLFKQLIPNSGDDLQIEPPFFCDYGYNIQLGNQVFMNYNCCILDVCEVSIGDNCMFGPAVQLYTATHPLEAEARNSGTELGKPIIIGHNVWLGGNCTICPGVTLGNNVVVGAGAVVTKSFPDNVFIAGNPAKVIKTFDN